MKRENSVSCALFCRVVDNYGDIGVCWRLARQLAAEHGWRVSLWVDDLASLTQLCPALAPGQDRQTLAGVDIRRWASPFAASAAADIVIEAFACQLPETYLAAMAARPRPPAWINLEYLSAEPWIESAHGLPSPHPRLNLVKHFFFPGFVPNSGGLLREAGLLEARRRWRLDWAGLGLAPARREQTNVSLFCYDNPALPELLQAWSSGPEPMRCLVSPGPGQRQTAAWLGLPSFAAGAAAERGRLELRALPFLAQEAYDHLLWSCEFNLVRGEDSFVRAQWAAAPLLWQAYPQAERAHLAKLDAWLTHYCSGLEASAAAAYRDLARLWNGDPAAPGDIATGWRRCWQHRQALAGQADSWAGSLSGSEDLATKLVKFALALI